MNTTCRSAGLRSLLAVARHAGRCRRVRRRRQPPVARPMPPPPPARRRVTPPPEPPAPAPEPTTVPPEPVPRTAIASASLDDLNRNSPLKPVFFELDSGRGRRRRPAGAAGQRGGAEAVPDLADHASKDTATSAAPPSTTWRSASGARSRRAPTSSRSASPPIASGRSATARSSRSTRATTRRRGRRTAARTS